MSQEQTQQPQQNTLAINLATFMTNKVTISLFSLLSIIILIIIGVAYKLSSKDIPVDYSKGSVFSNRQYDF